MERQVYQKFELALLKKLHYLVTDKTEGEAMLKPGGVLQGYQLAREVKTLKEIGKQCGCVFYVPPGYTSKIDPTTGFVDVFNMSGVTIVKRKKAFFEKFDKYVLMWKSGICLDFHLTMRSLQHIKVLIEMIGLYIRMEANMCGTL